MSKIWRIRIEEIALTGRGRHLLGSSQQNFNQKVSCPTAPEAFATSIQYPYGRLLEYRLLMRRFIDQWALCDLEDSLIPIQRKVQGRHELVSYEKYYCGKLQAGWKHFYAITIHMSSRSWYYESEIAMTLPFSH